MPIHPSNSTAFDPRWLLYVGLAILIVGVVKSYLFPSRAMRVRLGRGFDTDELARRLGLTAEELRAFRPSYRNVNIPKRRGGVRQLAVPDDATKSLQRRILRLLLAKASV